MDGVDGADGSTLHLVANATELRNAHLLCGQIYFVAGDSAFQVCSTAGWGAVDLTGPTMPALTGQTVPTAWTVQTVPTGRPRWR